MADININVEAKITWYSYQADGSNCMGCGDLICSKVYQPLMQFGKVTDLIYRDIDLQICQSCYEFIKQNNGTINK